eukprot:g80541.t1
MPRQETCQSKQCCPSQWLQKHLGLFASPSLQVDQIQPLPFKLNININKFVWLCVPVVAPGRAVVWVALQLNPHPVRPAIAITVGKLNHMIRAIVEVGLL